MSRYLSPKNDIVFKKIFGAHPHLLKSFLNAVLPLSETRKIETLEYLQAEQTPQIPILKRTIVDVKCIDKEGRIFIVEMQMEWSDYFMQRLLFGTAQAYVKQLTPGTTYKFLHPVYGLGILDAIFDKKTPEWYHHYGLVKLTDPKDEIIKGLTLVFVELPKFVPVTREDKRLQVLWFRFMREIHEETKIPDPAFQEVPEIAEALQLAEQASFTKGELQAYEDYWKVVSSERTLIEDNYDKGKKEGKKEGKTEGKEEVAKNMLNKKFTIEQIAELTGLSMKEIENLRT